jgi:outer membrane biosynthesis protein TonB
MPSELNRRAVFAAAAAFLLALAVAYALSSTGEASERTGPPGSPADQIDVASGIAGQATLGQAEGLPALVRKPKPEPKPKEPQVADTPAPTTVTPAPTVDTPTQTPTPTPTPTTEEPPVEFTDSG